MQKTGTPGAPSVSYPQPKEVGGRLIRNLIGALRRAKVKLPLTSHILVATSGGSDSIALAHLLLKYGRRVGRPSQFSLVHINHGWRGEASQEDAAFVKAFAKTWGVSLHLVEATPPTEGEKDSWEKLARDTRKRVFSQLAEQFQAVVLTAHHADDLAETVLWRVLTGAAQTHGAGIGLRHGVEIRPFLNIRKADLKQYLEEEGQPWREDATNSEGRFLRARMRREILPAIEMLFPKAVEHLCELGKLAVDSERREVNPPIDSKDPSALDEIGPELFLAASGLRVRRYHYDWIKTRLKDQSRCGELHLPQGWRLIRKFSKSERAEMPGIVESWIFERRT